MKINAHVNLLDSTLIENYPSSKRFLPEANFIIPCRSRSDWKVKNLILSDLSFSKSYPIRSKSDYVQ